MERMPICISRLTTRYLSTCRATLLTCISLLRAGANRGDPLWQVCRNDGLGQGPIEMHVPAVHKKMLAGNVPCSSGEEKYHHRRNFLRLSHSLLQGNFSENRFELFFRVRKRIQPLTVKRSHHFRGKNRIHADSIAEQLRRPFASEGQNRAL